MVLRGSVRVLSGSFWLQEGWFPLSYVREASATIQTLYSNDRSLSDTDLSGAKPTEENGDRDWTGVGETTWFSSLTVGSQTEFKDQPAQLNSFSLSFSLQSKVPVHSSRGGRLDAQRRRHRRCHGHTRQRLVARSLRRSHRLVSCVVRRSRRGSDVIEC